MNRRTRGESRDLPPREQTYRAGKQRNLHLARPWGETAQKRYLHALPSVLFPCLFLRGPQLQVCALGMLLAKVLQQDQPQHHLCKSHTS